MFPSLPAVRQLVRAEDIVRAAWTRCFPFAAGCCCFDGLAPCWSQRARLCHELTEADDATHRRAAHRTDKEEAPWRRRTKWLDARRLTQIAPRRPGTAKGDDRRGRT